MLYKLVPANGTLNQVILNMESGYEKFLKDDSQGGKISDELQTQLAPLKCPKHGDDAKFIIYNYQFNAVDNCCETFDYFLNNEAKKIVERLMSENDKK